MAWVFPVRSRLSVTACRTGWATVTFGGGGGCGLGFSLQPACRARSTDTVIQAAMRPIRRTAAAPPSAIVWLRPFPPHVVTNPETGASTAGHGRPEVAPVRAPLHLRLDLGRHDVLVFADLPAASQRPVDADEARRDVAEGAGQAVLLAQERLLGGEDGGEVRHAFPVPQDGERDRGSAGGDGL